MNFTVLFSDIDECSDDIHNCHTDGICTNTNGSFYCTCQVGYTGDGVNCTGNKNLSKLQIFITKITLQIDSTFPCC